MCNPTNIDEVLVQVTHLEASKVKHGMDNVYKNPSKVEKYLKGKEKGKNIATIKNRWRILHVLIAVRNGMRRPSVGNSS